MDGRRVEARPARSAERPSWSRILAAGLVVAFVDALFAMGLQLFYTHTLAPGRIFQGIASGVLGADAFQGGLATALLGAALHTGFACAWAVLYGVAYRQSATLRRLVRGPGAVTAAAFLFGALVWLVMNYVTKPLGGIDPTPASSSNFFVMLLGHGVFVGLPIVLIVRSRR